MILGSALALALAGLLWAAGAGDEEAVAFDHGWGFVLCNGNVASSTGSRNLMDDAPGAGLNNESAYVFVNANDSGNEQCRWRATLDVNTANFPVVAVRAAANDMSRLFVQLYTESNCTGSTLVTINFGASGDADADSAFHTVTEIASPGRARSVCLTLDDRANSHAHRVSALVDRIWIRSNGGSLIWEETFSRPD